MLRGFGKFLEVERFQRRCFLPVGQPQQDSRKSQSNRLGFGPMPKFGPTTRQFLRHFPLAWIRRGPKRSTPQQTRASLREKWRASTIRDPGHTRKHLRILAFRPEAVIAHDDRPRIGSRSLNALLHQQTICFCSAQVGGGFEIRSQFLLREIDQIKLELGTGFELPNQKKSRPPNCLQRLKIWIVKNRPHQSTDAAIDHV